MNFVQEVLDATIEYEAPRRFYYWSALSAVSAVLKDQVWMDMAGNYQLFPNIYVLLYGPSGVRKGPAIALAEKLVKKVDNTRVINGRASLEAIIKVLGTSQSRPGKEPFKTAHGFVVASELSSSIISNQSSMDVFTNLYDRIYNVGDWEYKLKVGESVSLKNPTITWLSGTNEALFKEFMPEKNINGGLIGRMFMISENRPARLNSLMYKPGIIPDIEKLGASLREISLLRGEFTMTDEVRGAADNFYLNFMSETAPKLKDETGFVSRVGDFLIKNAMLLAAGKRGSKEIQLVDYAEAIEVTLPLIVPTKKTSQSLKHKKDIGLVEKRNLVLTYLARREGFTAERKTVLKDLSLRLDHEDLDNVIQLFIQMGIAKIDSQGSEVYYKLKTDNPKVRKWIEEEYGSVEGV